MPKKLHRSVSRSAAKAARAGRLLRKKGETVAEAKERYTHATLRKIKQRKKRKKK